MSTASECSTRTTRSWRPSTHPDVKWHGGTLGTVEGAEGLVKLLQGSIGALPDLNPQEQDIVANEDTVVVRFVVEATHQGELLGIPPTGRRVRWDTFGRRVPAQGRKDQRGRSGRRPTARSLGRRVHTAVALLAWHDTLDEAMSYAYSQYDAISDWRFCPDDADPLEISPGAIRSLIDIPPIATPREKQLTLLAAVLGTSVVFLDATVTSVALPAIRGDLGGGLAGQQWVTNAYLLTLGSLLLIGGSLGDVFGQKRVFLVGVAGFGITSALCAVASSIPELCVLRAMQGMCAALVTPTALGLIVHVFPEDERARAIGTWTALSSIVGVIGPFIGGVLIAAGSWRLIFLLNAPLVLVTVTLIARGVPQDASAGCASRLPRGALGGARALGFGVRCDRGAGARWNSLVIDSLAAGIVGAMAFIAHEAQARAPMLPLSLFRERNFTIGNLTTLTAYLGLGGVVFLLPVFLQEVSGYSPVQAGLALLPVTSLMIVLSRRFGALADRIGSRVLIGVWGSGC